MKLKKNFYSRDTTLVAKQLIGKILCRKLPSGVIVKSIITETEAYLGIEDRAAHTFGGRRTARNEAMWGDAGLAYVYIIYGLHYCLNVVTRMPEVPEAVLIRGAIPIDNSIQRNRWLAIEPNRSKWNRIMSGPGRLCKVLKIDKTLNGLSLLGTQIWIESGKNISSKQIVKTPRVGIDYTLNDPAGSHQWPLRFLLKSELSKKVKARARKKNSNQSKR